MPTWTDALELVRQFAQSGATETTIERPGLRLFASTVDTPATADPLTAVPSPVMGIFYRRPAPDAPPFVEPGDAVEPGTTLAIVEVMKLMMPVTAEVAGRVARVCAEDGAMVEEAQPLFLVEVEVPS